MLCKHIYNLGRTRVRFDFAHAHPCVHPSNFAACLTQTSRRMLQNNRLDYRIQNLHLGIQPAGLRVKNLPGFAPSLCLHAFLVFVRVNKVGEKCPCEQSRVNRAIVCCKSPIDITYYIQNNTWTEISSSAQIAVTQVSTVNKCNIYFILNTRRSIACLSVPSSENQGSLGAPLYN